MQALIAGLAGALVGGLLVVWVTGAATRPVIPPAQAPVTVTSDQRDRAEQPTTSQAPTSQYAPVVQPQTPVIAVPPSTEPKSRKISEAEAASWCPGCSAARFAPLETYGGNPEDVGIKLKPGPCVTLNLPAGYYGQSWDGVKAVAVEGPAQIKSCEASIRKEG